MSSGNLSLFPFPTPLKPTPHTPHTPQMDDEVEERAVIMEHERGLSREEAESRARGGVMIQRATPRRWTEGLIGGYWAAWTISTTVFSSFLDAATVRVLTNLLALPGPAALWIRSRSAWVNRKANTTSSSLGALVSFTLAGAFAFFAAFFLAMSFTSSTSPMLAHTQGRCLIFLGQDALDQAIAEYAAHYHEERSHQGIGNEMISGAKAQGKGVVETRERLGGLLKYYHRRAA